MLIGLLFAAWTARADTAGGALEAALAVGDCGRAVAEDPAPTEEGPRLGVARCLVSLARPKEALPLLDSLKGGPLDAYARLTEGEALLASGDAAAAASALAEVSLQGESGQRVAALRGQALLGAGQLAAAREVLRPLLEGSLGEAGQLPQPGGADPAEVRWALAEGAVRRGEPANAVVVWQALWSRNPTSPLADRAAQALAEAGHPVPDRSTPEGIALAMARVKTLEKLQLYPQALALRDLLPPTTARAEARAAFQAHDYPRAAAAFSKVPDLRPNEAFDAALATSRAGRYDDAAWLYTELYTKHRTDPVADFASFKVGYLSYDAGDLEKAIGLLRDHLERYPSSTHADEARWFIAWSLVRLDRRAEALPALAELTTRHPRSSLAPAAKYWTAHLLADAGDANGARLRYESLLLQDPTSGYAWFAAERLGRRWPAQALVKPPPLPAALQTAAARRGAALAAAGLDRWALAELAPLIPTAKAAGRESALAMAHLLIRAGGYTEAQRLAAPYCVLPWKGGDPVAQQACHPRPAASLVDALTAAEQLDPNLPYGIMNAESGLLPWVTSPAGARGLMQLMPALGGTVHAIRFPSQAYNADDLYRPAYNAALGTTELGQLRARFASSGASPLLPLIIAGYNGGGDAVARWLASDPKAKDGDWFAESVGYTETRQYVRRVLGFLQTWRYVYGG